MSGVNVSLVGAGVECVAVYLLRARVHDWPMWSPTT